jgi:hypothetical protein
MHLVGKEKHRLKVNRHKKIFQVSRSQKQGVAILRPDKTDFKPKFIRRDKESHFTLIKQIIHQQDIIIANTYTLNFSLLNFIKQTLLDIETQIDVNTVTVGYFNTPLSQLDRSTRPKTN